MASGISMKTSPWGKKQTELEEPIVSFVDIMSEELAEQLEEVESAESGLDSSLAQYGLTVSDVGEGADDLTLARALQAQFDREYEMSLKEEEKKQRGTKIEVNFKPYLPSYDVEGDYDEESSEDDEDIRELATNLFYENVKEEFPPCGFVKDAEGNVITKHDKEVMERRNTNKVMQLPIDFPTGDVVGEKLSDRVFNTLRAYSKTDQKRNIRVKDKEEKAISEQSMDAATRMILYKWINSGELFDRVEGVIATGKESVVLHAATRADNVLNLEEAHYAIKVYKMTLAEFKNRSEYVQNDYRFKNPRRVLRVWAEKEFMNLHRMFRAGLRCPEPIRLRRHVMMMSLIGSGGRAAPKLKSIEWEDQESKADAFQQVREAMSRMFKECRLVHGDLSEFNILYHLGHAYIIDVSQAIDVSHPRSLFFLLRDIENVLEYFGRVGTEELPSATELFNEITGLCMDPEKNLLVQVEHFEKDNRSVQLREDKANPADRELRLYDAEVAITHEDPAELYN
uniref:Serine/threonine-protein kinase RIO3 n=2 Tax=Ascaris TaxID=6251 RepID=A0A0M3HQQ3_ASCLU